MKKDKIKIRISQFISKKTNDHEFLEQFYFTWINSVKSSDSLWNSLTLAQQREVLQAYEESEDENQLLSISDIKSKFK